MKWFGCGTFHQESQESRGGAFERWIESWWTTLINELIYWWLYSRMFCGDGAWSEEVAHCKSDMKGYILFPASSLSSLSWMPQDEHLSLPKSSYHTLSALKPDGYGLNPLTTMSQNKPLLLWSVDNGKVTTGPLSFNSFTFDFFLPFPLSNTFHLRFISHFVHTFILLYYFSFHSFN